MVLNNLSAREYMFEARRLRNVAASLTDNCAIQPLLGEAEECEARAARLLGVSVYLVTNMVIA